MDIVTSVSALRARLQREPNNVFVPTMGNLHAGHIDLIRIAKPKAACTVVSIFVNRLQFGPKEDFERYPRTFQNDCDKLRSAGVNVVFAPDEKEIYPEPQTFVVEPSDLQHILDGAFRPGHFRGVATVVLKLFNLVMPHAAIFGKKDYQQYLVLRDMVRQLALPVEIIPAETVRAVRDVGGTLVAVGPHASTTPGATLRKLGVDIAVMGECEEILPRLDRDWRSVLVNEPGVHFQRDPPSILRENFYLIRTHYRKTGHLAANIVADHFEVFGNHDFCKVQFQSFVMAISGNLLRRGRNGFEVSLEIVAINDVACVFY